MSKELVISANRHETKVALIEDDQLVEVYFQRANEYSLAGSIHKGRVTRVLPGMQSAFVDVGLDRDTFLYVSDFLEEHEDFDKITGDERPVRDRDRDRGRDRGRDRDRGSREPREAAPAYRPPVQAPSEEAVRADIADDSAVTVTSASPVAAAVERPANGSGPVPSGEPEERERRGRRSRRRRRGGQGFPDSKYASDSARPAAAMEPGVAEPEAAAALEAETEAAVEAPMTPAWVPSPVASIVLPGESLAKYRHAPPREPAAEPQPPAVSSEPASLDEAGALEETEVEENEFDEPSHYPPENALPDAPLHNRAADPELTEVPEVPGRLAVEAETETEAEPAEAADFVPETLESAEISEHLAGESEDEPAVAPLLNDDEDSDIQAMILGDVEGIEIAPSEEGASAGEAAAESGSASVRERGGRFPHRVSRRRRRGRGQGSQGGQDSPDQAATQQARPEAAGGESNGVEAVREEQPRQERQPRQEHTVSRPNQGQPSISDLLKEGQEIIVQIAKEPLGPKGARITSHIALPGRYVVYMPTLEHMGVSRKIASDEERLRLKRILQGKRPGPVGGFITRTAAEGRTEDEIAGDMLFLYNLWQDIRTKADKRPAPMMLHHDLDIVQRILRDQLADSFKAIWIDNEETYESVLRFVERFQPVLVPKVKLYTRDAPIFDAFSVTNELEKALRPKVWLKSGGFIVINQTEALVAIDVNTGKYVGKTNRLEDTIVKTNTEAIKEIVRQIRLRDLGGIIVIDFIDMDERKNRQKVMQTLEEAMRVDRAPYKILQFNDFGLVAITRKRVKQSLERTLCAPCPHCEGAGYVKSPQTVVSEILTEARKLSRSIEGKEVMLRVHPDVAKVLKSHQNKFLEELEETLRRPVLVKSDPQLHHEKFDLA
ncbi:MAG: Rne/Rng family ribonuclease [Acidobacteriota bacterium]